MSSYKSPADRRVVEVDSATREPIAVYDTMTEASKMRDISRSALYEAINNGLVCSGSRWFFAAVYEKHVAIHGGVPLPE